MSEKKSSVSVNRRELLTLAGAATLATALPVERATAQPNAKTAPAKPLRLAAVGVGSQSTGDLPNILDHKEVKLVAICDVDRAMREKAANAYDASSAQQFADYRQMLKTMWGDIDAVYIATPDHMHAPIGLASIAKGMHVYQQKPLARSVGECRALKNAIAKNSHLATQMGIQIHGESAYRSAVKWLKLGVIGKVREVHSICGKGWGGAQPGKAPDPIPETLDWNLYCGVSPQRPYIKDYYHPYQWRRWQAFGTGTLGDMACHILDPVFTGLEILTPLSVVSHGDAPPNSDNYPYNSHIEWTLAGSKYTTPTVNLHWYHGDARPPQTIAPAGANIPGAGSVLIGDNGWMIIPHWAMPTVYRKNGMMRTELPEPAPSISHYHQWVDVALGHEKGPCEANFLYAAPLTEVVLMGNIASWWTGKVLNWDAEACHFTGAGVEAANNLILPTYRDGWMVPFINS